MISSQREGDRISPSESSVALQTAVITRLNISDFFISLFVKYVIWIVWAQFAHCRKSFTEEQESESYEVVAYAYTDMRSKSNRPIVGECAIAGMYTYAPFVGLWLGC